MASLLESLQDLCEAARTQGAARRPPVVRPVFASGDEFKFNGMVVIPVRDNPGAFEVRAETRDRPWIVVRDEHVLLAEIEPVEPPRAGFHPIDSRG